MGICCGKEKSANNYVFDANARSIECQPLTKLDFKNKDLDTTTLFNGWKYHCDPTDPSGGWAFFDDFQNPILEVASEVHRKKPEKRYFALGSGMIVDLKAQTVFWTNNLKRQYPIKRCKGDKQRSGRAERFNDDQCVLLREHNPPHYLAQTFEAKQDIEGCEYPSLESIVAGIVKYAHSKCGEMPYYTKEQSKAAKQCTDNFIRHYLLTEIGLKDQQFNAKLTEKKIIDPESKIGPRFLQLASLDIGLIPAINKANNKQDKEEVLALGPISSVLTSILNDMTRSMEGLTKSGTGNKNSDQYDHGKFKQKIKCYKSTALTIQELQKYQGAGDSDDDSDAEIYLSGYVNAIIDYNAAVENAYEYVKKKQGKIPPKNIKKGTKLYPVVFKIEIANMSGQFFVPMADYSMYSSENEILISNWMSYQFVKVEQVDDHFEISLRSLAC